MKEYSIQLYRDLKVWQESINLAVSCYELTKLFPQEETYGITSQIRRAAASIPANIADGYGRRTREEYIHLLYIAQGSLKELETYLLLSLRLELMPSLIINSNLEQCNSVGQLLLILIHTVESKRCVNHS